MTQRTYLNGYQPVHAACLRGKLEVGQWLVAQGAAIDASDSNGQQLIHYSCSKGHLPIVQWLVSQGAAVDAAVNSGQQPLQMAQKLGHHQVAAFLESELSKLRLQRFSRRRTNKQQAVKPAQMSQEEAEQAELARQQAELELLAMLDGDDQSKKKKKASKNSNNAVIDDGAGAEGEMSGRSEVAENIECFEEAVETTLAAAAECGDTDQELNAQAAQHRKMIKGKLKKLRSKVARALGAFEEALGCAGCWEEELANAISQAESSSDALLDLVQLAKAGLEDAQHKEVALETPDHEFFYAVEHEFVALAMSQPEENQTIEAPMKQQEDLDDSELCVVCISNPKRVLLLPCRHMCVCVGCCESVLQVEPLCPLCRAHVETHIEVFM